MTKALLCRPVPCHIFAGMSCLLIIASVAQFGSFADGQTQSSVRHALDSASKECVPSSVKVKAAPAEIGEPLILGYRVDESLLKDYPADVANALRAKQSTLGYIRILAVSENGFRIAYQSFQHAHHDKESGRWIFLEDLEAQEELGRIEIAPRGFGGGAPFGEPPPRRRFLPGNRLIVFETAVKIRNLADPNQTIECAASRHGLILDVSPCGKLICGVSTRGELVLWSSADGRLVHRLGERHSASILAARFSRDGRFLISEHSVIVEDSPKPRVCELQGRLWDCSTGKSLGRVGDPLRVELRDGQCEGTLAGQRLDKIGAFASGFDVTISPTGIIATVPVPERLKVRQCGDHRIKLLDPFGKELAGIELEDATIRQLFLSEDNSVLFVGVKLNTTAAWLVWSLQPVTKKLAESRELEKEDLDRIHRDLRSDDMQVASNAYAQLSVAPPDQIVTFISGFVKPSVSIDGVDVLLDDLDSDEPKRRARAQKQLLVAGEQAIIALNEAMNRSKSLDFIERAAFIIAEWNRAHGSEYRRAVWCIHLLRRIDSVGARQLLVKLSRGAPGTWVTCESTKVLKAQRSTSPD